MNNNLEMFELLINYANEKNIILELNEKDNKSKYPFLIAFNNNIEMTQLLIDYANKKNIALELTDYNNDYGFYSLLFAIEKDNIEVVKFLMNTMLRKMILN